MSANTAIVEVLDGLASQAQAMSSTRETGSAAQIGAAGAAMAIGLLADALRGDKTTLAELAAKLHAAAPLRTAIAADRAAEDAAIAAKPSRDDEPTGSGR